MPKTQRIFSSFTNGEISPRLSSRIDYDKYFNSCEKLENFFIFPHGGVTRRSGTVFVSEVKDSTKKTRVIPFKFNVSEAYIIEVGEYYFRFYKSHARLLSGGVAYEISTPYKEEHLFELQFAPSADVMYITHSSYPTRKLSRTGDISWTLSTVKFDPAPSFIADTDLNETLTPSAITGEDVTFTAGTGVFLPADVDRLIIFGASRAVITAWTDATVVVADIIDDWPDTSAMAAGSWKLGGSPSCGLTPSAKSPVKKRIKLTVELESTKSVSTMTRSGSTVTVVTSTSHGYVTGEYVLIAGASPSAYNSGWKITVTNATTFTFDIGSLTPSSPATGTITSARAKAAFRAADAGKYVKINDGLCKIKVVTSAVEVKADILSVLSVKTESEAGLWSLEVESWSDTYGYPAACAFFQQRLYLGGSNQQPITVWGSTVDLFENFAVGTSDDNSLEYTLTAQNKIRWLAEAKNLAVGTAGDERILGTGDDTALTPSNVKAAKDTTYGCALIAPITVGNTTLFVQRAGRKLRELAFVFENDSYKAPDLTILAEHITEGGIMEIAYQQEPDSLVYGVRGDGQLLTMTYQRDEGVIGWARQITQGLFDSAAVIPVAGKDEVWVVVARQIAGVWKRYIEYFSTDMWVASNTFQWTQAMTDSAIKYSGVATTVITGLGHLEGKLVSVLANGGLHAAKTVMGGTIPLDISATEVEVGLHYLSDGLTVRPELDTATGSIQGKIKGWSAITARLYKTLGGKINDEPIETRTSADLMDASPPVFSGDFTVYNLGYDTEGKISFSQPEALPFTLLSIAGALSVE